ncbi:MAG: sigma-54-dependent Fis family transcriptional regulator, partial [Calditrichaeota bacterium]|nr:sigma-54-dependent Fis family transcriptional regulator [Calditrichota bacterium]
MSGHNILVIDDEEFIRLNLQNILQEEHHRIFLCSSGKEAIATVQNSDFSLVLLDLNLPDMNGIDILRQLKQIQPNLLVIIITGFASVESAVEAIKLGAYDYIKKPFKADAIKLIVKLALETQALKERVKQLLQTHKPTGLNTILGDSAEILKVKHQILEFAKYDSETVLITGESG